MAKLKKMTLSKAAQEHANLRKHNKIEIICLYLFVGSMVLSLFSFLLYAIIFEI